MKNIPEKIYLQIGDECDSEDFNELSEVSWCKDKIYDNDIEFVQNKVSDVSAEEESEYSLLLTVKNELLEADKLPFSERVKANREILDSVSIKRKPVGNENIPPDFKQVTGHDSPKEMMAYEKGREDEQQVIIEWIEKWDGSSNSVMGATLKKVLKKFERKDSADIEEKLKLECRRIKIQRNEYEQELIRTRRKVSRLNAIIKSQPKQKEVDEERLIF